MYRVGIVTIEDCYNFGNRLQNLAMEKLLNDLGYEVHTFHRRYSPLANISVKMYLKILLGKYQKISKYFLDKTFIYQRFNSFYLFNKEYINWDKHNLEDVSGKLYLKKNYDALIVGSDQVWNFKFDFNTKENLLDKIPSGIRKISIAASVGVTELSGKEARLFENYLNTFDAVSVREASAISLLQPYYQREIVQIIDPTLLVKRKYWENLQNNSRLKIRKAYIVLFFLGAVSDAIKMFAEKLSKQFQLQIVELNDINNLYYGIGPIDFLKLIYDAGYVLTDSFHCSVFSILFQKRFSVYNRDTNQMDSSNRTDELLKLFGLKNVRNIFSLSNLVDQNPQNSDFIDKVLEEEKKKVEKFIKNSLE